MWNLDVPKRVFFYWGGKRLSFLRYMTIYSFKKLNPDWEVCFYTPIILNSKAKWGDKQFENQSNILDYTRSVAVDLGIRQAIFDFEKIGLSNELNEVHKSDFIRYYLLSEYGGVWSDMDILFIKPMDQLYHNKNNIKSSTYYYHEGQGVWEHAIGFLMAEKGSKYFTDVFDSSKRWYKHMDYQCVGATMLNDHFKPEIIKQKYPDAVSLDKNSVYSINHDDREFLYNKTDLSKLTDDSVGIHWYGGSQYVKKLTLGLNHKNFNVYNNDGTVVNMIRELFGKDF